MFNNIEEYIIKRNETTKYIDDVEFALNNNKVDQNRVMDAYNSLNNAKNDLNNIDTWYRNYCNQTNNHGHNYNSHHYGTQNQNNYGHNYNSHNLDVPMNTMGSKGIHQESNHSHNNNQSNIQNHNNQSNINTNHFNNNKNIEPLKEYTFKYLVQDDIDNVLENYGNFYRYKLEKNDDIVKDLNLNVCKDMGTLEDVNEIIKYHLSDKNDNKDTNYSFTIKNVLYKRIIKDIDNDIDILNHMSNEKLTIKDKISCLKTYLNNKDMLEDLDLYNIIEDIFITNLKVCFINCSLTPLEDKKDFESMMRYISEYKTITKDIEELNKINKCMLLNYKAVIHILQNNTMNSIGNGVIDLVIYKLVNYLFINNENIVNNIEEQLKDSDAVMLYKHSYKSLHSYINKYLNDDTLYHNVKLIHYNVIDNVKEYDVFKTVYDDKFIITK
jgi:hypothetical protein